MNFIKSKCARHLFCEVQYRVPELCPFLKLLNPYKESLCIKLLQQLSNLNVFCCFLKVIKLLENSYIDDLIVCIVRKKFDNKLTNSPYVSLLCDITTYNF